jgi:predicted transcriptional regulator
MDWSPLAQAVWNLVAGMTRQTKTRPDRVHRQFWRDRILDTLSRDPGKNLARICDELRVPRGTASYHLYILERAGAIRRLSAPHTTHFFPARMTPEERSGLAVLHRERALEVALKLIDRPGIEQRELLREIGMDLKVFLAYREALAAEGLVEIERHGRRHRCSPTPKLLRLVEALRAREGPPPPGSAPSGPALEAPQ